MSLLGVDIGFSERRATTGIAYLHNGCLTVRRVRSDPDDRRAVLPQNFIAHAAAFDGPVLPAGAPPAICRTCESVFIRDAYHNRCKPGLSHHGTGLRLRQASVETQRHLGHFVDGSVVEAFPNLFLGVLTPACLFEIGPRPRRGRRFDWLYDRTVATRLLEALLRDHAELPQRVWDCLASEQDHEKRAALICLVTAALEANRAATKVGDDAGGWFCLPPSGCWQPWARTALDRIVASGQFPALRVMAS